MEAIYNEGRAKQLKEASKSINPIANFATRMETASLLVHATFIPFLASIVCSTIGSSTATKPYGLVTKLIHYDSILSPFHNAKASTSDRAIRAVENSIARLAYLKAASESSSNDIRGDVIAANSRGYYALEKLTFVTPDEGTIEVRNVVFGCAQAIYEPFEQSSGILGLGSKKLSLAIRMDFMFFYCIGNISDPRYTHNQLILRKGAVLQGYSTPLEVHKDLYHLSLEGISVGIKRLPIPPVIFQRDQKGNGGVIIDSGRHGATSSGLHLNGLREKCKTGLVENWSSSDTVTTPIGFVK
ncbi:hypothetical protein RJ639_008896 [Escallonia herrerae]|uniref:Uncharacterized protein n=1 Tax=Escallonia herrerae TaxID=1293975 RepID=A0AA88VRK5_9ASTE|nr:hypothetical protein RJ639_008896 [Escallonia herrerae]